MATPNKRVTTLRLNVINQSNLAVTLSELTIMVPPNVGYSFKSPNVEVNHPLPYRLEPRDSIQAKYVLDDILWDPRVPCFTNHKTRFRTPYLFIATADEWHRGYELDIEAIRILRKFSDERRSRR